MKIDCPYLQRFHNIFCYLTIIDTQTSFPSPDYLVEKWLSIIGDIMPVIPTDIDPRDINEWEKYKKHWLWHFPVEDPFTEKVKAIFLLSFISSTYQNAELKLKVFQHFGISIRSIKSDRCVGVHVKVREYATKLIFQDAKDLITGYIRELKMEDTLKD